MNMKTFYNVTYGIMIASLILYAVLLALKDRMPFVMHLNINSLLFVFSCTYFLQSLVTKEIVARDLTVRKLEKPKLYYFLLCMILIAAINFLIVAIRNKN